ncbi:MAG: GNAT family N-acetyltransferase [Anaerolineae bacterium]
MHAAPGTTTDTRFGRFVHDSRFPTRHDAHQLLDARCTPDEVPTLLGVLDELYEGAGCAFQKMTLHDASTAQHLIPQLVGRGWSCRRENLMPLRHAPVRFRSEEVDVRVVPYDDPEAHRARVALANHGHLRALRYRQAQDQRIGGEVLIGYLGGEPAGTTGWFVVDGVARFRPVSTIERFRLRGVATTLILHVQDHPAVRAADALVIFCGDDGPIRLYEQLGFEREHAQWSCFRALPGYPGRAGGF